MTERTALNWHCYLPERRARAALRLPRRTGPTRRSEGHRFNPAKLLIDPYAKAIDGRRRLGARRQRAALRARPASEDADLEPDDEDDAAAMPKSVVIDDAFDWEGDRPPRIPFADTVIYETHVKGFTMRHPDVREDLRGTYAGLASERGDRLPRATSA